MSASSPSRRLAAAVLCSLAAIACGGGGGAGGSNVPSPVVTAIEPNFGYSTSQTAVVITGDNFLVNPNGGTQRAWLGDTPLLDVTRVSVSKLTATVPSGLSAGAKTLRVENAYGQNGSLANAFTVDPGGLTAGIAVTPEVVNAKKSVQVTFTVGNGGSSTVNVTSVEPSVSFAAASASGTGSCTAVTPSTLGSVGPKATRAFTWTCSADAAGTLTLSGTVHGKDTATALDVSATPSGPKTVTVQAPAHFQATLAVEGNPSIINVGQTVTVDGDVTNTGDAPAHVNQITLSPSSCSGIAPTLPQPIPGHQTVRFTWTCTPSAKGSFTMGATFTGSDDNDPASSPSAKPSVTVPVQLPASLVGIVSATLVGGAPGSSVASVGQKVNLSMSLVNGGAAVAQVSDIQASYTDPSGSTASVDCSKSPPTPRVFNLAANGGTRTVTWACDTTGSAAGDVNLTAVVTATDGTSGAPVPDTVVPFTLTVQTPAAVVVNSLGASPTTVDTGQKSKVSLELQNDGQAAALVTVTPAPDPSGPNCGGALPPQTIAGLGGKLDVSWTCTSTGSGSFKYDAIITAVDANDSGFVTSPKAGAVPTVVVQTPPTSLTTTLVASPSTTSFAPGDTVTLMLTVTNPANATTGASVSITGVAPTPTSGVMSCPATPTTGTVGTSLAGGATATYGWTCTATAAGSATLDATVSAATVNQGATVSAPVDGIGVTVAEVPLEYTFTSDVTSVPSDIGGTVTLSLAVSNPSSANYAAAISAVDATIDATNAAGFTCTGPTVSTSLLPGQGTGSISWSCATSGGAPGDSSTLGAHIAASDATTDADLSLDVPGITVTLTAPSPPPGP